MNQVLCSVGALIGRANNRNHRLLIPLSEQLACDGFEFLFYSSWYDSIHEIVADLQKSKLSFPTFHCEKHVGEKISIGGKENIAEALRLFEINCRTAQALGSRTLVLHLWDGQPSDQHFEHNFSTYPLLREISDRYSLALTVENVVCNRTDPLTHLKELADAYPDIRFTYDTKMATFHGQHELIYEPAQAWLWNKNHISHLHINDYAGGIMDWANLKTLHLGDGHVDFERFFRFLPQTGYQGDYTIEATSLQPDGTVDIDKLNHDFTRLRSLLQLAPTDTQ